MFLRKGDGALGEGCLENEFCGTFFAMNDAGTVLLTGGYESGTHVYSGSSTLLTN